MLTAFGVVQASLRAALGRDVTVLTGIPSVATQRYSGPGRLQKRCKAPPLRQGLLQHLLSSTAM